MANPKGLISHTPGTPSFWPPEFVHSFHLESSKERYIGNEKVVEDIPLIKPKGVIKE